MNIGEPTLPDVWRLFKITWPILLGTLLCILMLCSPNIPVSDAWISLCAQLALYAWGIRRMFKLTHR